MNTTAIVETTGNYEITPEQIKVISEKAILPKDYQRNEGNLILAYELSRRKGYALMDVVQNMSFINGRPSWSAEYQRAALNRSGYIIPPVRYRMDKDASGKTYACTAYVKLAATGETIEGDTVTLEMAEADGWTKNAKWRTMPEIMLKNRATTFLIRYNFPEVLDGIKSADEAEDIAAIERARKSAPVPPIQYEDKTEPANSANYANSANTVDEVLAKADEAIAEAKKSPSPKRKLYEQAMSITKNDENKAFEYCARALEAEGMTSGELTDDNYATVAKHFVDFAMAQ